jgi:hypothetical protein
VVAAWPGNIQANTDIELFRFQALAAAGLPGSQPGNASPLPYPISFPIRQCWIVLAHVVDAAIWGTGPGKERASRELCCAVSSREPRILLPSFSSLLLITAAVMVVFQSQARSQKFLVACCVADRSRCAALQSDVIDVWFCFCYQTYAYLGDECCATDVQRRTGLH